MASAKRTRQRLLREAAATVVRVRSDLVGVDEAKLSAGTAAIKLISPGWGSSGYYGPDVLEAAGNDRVFARGTQMFLDHPGLNERHDRPERSVKDLAAVLETDGTWQANGPEGPGIYAQAKVFETYRPILAEIAPYIGVSIRAAAQMGTGEAEGRRGPIVERIVEAVSVDFVTRAGRGGAVLSVLEAAGHDVTEARNIGEWMQSRIHLDFTTRADDMFGDGRLTKDERIALSSGIGAALDAFATTVEDLAPQLLTRDLWADPAVTTTTESQEGHMPITAEEQAAIAAAAATAVVSQLTEAGVIPKPGEKPKPTEATEATKELTEATERAERAERALLLESARRHVTDHEKVKGLPSVARDAVVGKVVNEAKAGTDGKLDTAALDEATVKAVEAEVKYLAEATGSPVKGAGGESTTTSESTVDANEASLTDLFKDLGLTDDAAKIAVGGR